MSDIPGDLKFLKSHEWVRAEGNGRAVIGISDHAQGLLGDLVYVDGWLFVVEVSDAEQLNELLGPDEYAELLESEEH